jgi:hypothetical protein
VTDGIGVTRTPHDALFRFAFSRAENAAGELRAVLPPALATRIDWLSLTLTDGHFIDEDLDSDQANGGSAAKAADGTHAAKRPEPPGSASADSR